MSLYIGLMSGTSMDGIDAALIDTTNHCLIAGITRPYGDQARQWLNDAMAGAPLKLGVLNQLNTLLGREFASAVKELLEHANISNDKIIAIGSHGQTLGHDVTTDLPYTIQLGCAHTISELTGITVVADFRTRDLIVGGQGAPFAPIYHQALFGNLENDIAVVNIGGIANITYLAMNGSVSGHDVGPGNCLMDAWITRHLNQPFDRDGEWASTGHVLMPLLDILYADSYFHRMPPKSIGKEYFSLAWLKSSLNSNYAPNDVQATLAALTVRCISDALKQSNFNPKQLFVCGGGVHNKVLLTMLSHELPTIRVTSTQVMGADPDYIEAMMFAWLAEKTINSCPIDLTQITGAKKATMLGAIYPACRFL